jgi:hypothetical protein
MSFLSESITNQSTTTRQPQQQQPDNNNNNNNNNNNTSGTGGRVVTWVMEEGAGTDGELEQAYGLLGLGRHREGDVFELQLVGLDALKVENVAHERQQMLRAGCEERHVVSTE